VCVCVWDFNMDSLQPRGWTTRACIMMDTVQTDVVLRHVRACVHHV